MTVVRRIVMWALLLAVAMVASLEMMSIVMLDIEMVDVMVGLTAVIKAVL